MKRRGGVKFSLGTANPEPLVTLMHAIEFVFEKKKV
jgi:hypothetical protein